ncbi:MAG: CHASE2 domain-containing protein [bacterium]
MGRWPWSRRKIKALIEVLSETEAEIIAFEVTFPSSEQNILDEFIICIWVRY